MLTVNVGQGHAVAGCGNASASAARNSVPRAPPTKMAASSRRSIRGSLRGAGRPGGGPGPEATTRLVAGASVRSGPDDPAGP